MRLKINQLNPYRSINSHQKAQDERDEKNTKLF